MYLQFFELQSPTTNHVRKSPWFQALSSKGLVNYWCNNPGTIALGTNGVNDTDIWIHQHGLKHVWQPWTSCVTRARGIGQSLEPILAYDWHLQPKCVLANVVTALSASEGNIVWVITPWQYASDRNCAMHGEAMFGLTTMLEARIGRHIFGSKMR